MKEYLTYIGVGISLIALAISVLTFYFTRVRRGKVLMTRPTTIFFGPDGGENKEKNNKIFVRTLLYNTAERGQYIQNMFIRLQRGESVQNFNIWVYDDGRLVRGSGLFIDEKGVVANHHFLLPKDSENYNFLAGKYSLQVFVELVNKKPLKIFEYQLHLTKDEQDQLVIDKRAGIFFDWATNNQNYTSHIRIRPFTSEELTSLLV